MWSAAGSTLAGHDPQLPTIDHNVRTGVVLDRLHSLGRRTMSVRRLASTVSEVRCRQMPHPRHPNERVRNIADALEREHHHRQYVTAPSTLWRRDGTASDGHATTLERYDGRRGALAPPCGPRAGLDIGPVPTTTCRNCSRSTKWPQCSRSAGVGCTSTHARAACLQASGYLTSRSASTSALTPAPCVRSSRRNAESRDSVPGTRYNRSEAKSRRANGRKGCLSNGSNETTVR